MSKKKRRGKACNRLEHQFFLHASIAAMSNIETVFASFGTIVICIAIAKAIFKHHWRKYVQRWSTRTKYLINVLVSESRPCSLNNLCQTNKVWSGFRTKVIVVCSPWKTVITWLTGAVLCCANSNNQYDLELSLLWIGTHIKNTQLCCIDIFYYQTSFYRLSFSFLSDVFGF